MPAQPDEERAVVAVVRGPPVLRGGHHVEDVPLQGLDVEGLDRCGVVEVVTQRAGLRGVLVQHRQVELVRPPVLVRPRPGPLGGGGVDGWVLALATVRHGGAPWSVVGWWFRTWAQRSPPPRTRGIGPSR